MSEQYDVAVVLGTKNRARRLDQMLKSLLPAMEGVNYEIVVIDGDSIDNTSDILKKHKIQNAYVESKCLGEGRHSWGEIYNFGFSKSIAKWGMYCSNDIVFNSECFSRAIRILDEQPKSVVGGAFYYRTLPSDSQFKRFGVDYTFGQKLMMNYGLISREAFWEVGGLDTSYKFYCADGDLCFKLYEKNKNFIPLPGCLITHYKGKQSNLCYGREDIAKYKTRWKKYVDIVSYPNPRRLWLTEEEHLMAVMGNLSDCINQLKEKFLGAQLNAIELGTIPKVSRQTRLEQSTALIFRALGERGHLISVDIDASHIEASKEVCHDANNVTWVQSDSIGYLKNLKDVKFHFAFLDTLNEKDFTFEEFRLIIPMMLEGSILVIDDAGITEDGHKIDPKTPAQKGHEVWKFLQSCEAKFLAIPYPNSCFPGTQLKIVLDVDNLNLIKAALIERKEK